jgi:hypothetical protein
MPLTRAQAGILGADTLSTGPVSINVGVPIIENSQTIQFDYSLTTGSNAISAGTIIIALGATVTIPEDSSWSII